MDALGVAGWALIINEANTMQQTWMPHQTFIGCSKNHDKFHIKNPSKHQIQIRFIKAFLL